MQTWRWMLVLLLALGCGDDDKDSADDGPQDRDGDGFTDVEDCDDTDPEVNLLATEICDGKDNNCDNRVDEPESADLLIWYPDLDGDGFGIEGGTIESCEQPFGYSSISGDCDDTDANTYPGAPENCSDSKDNNCDGQINEGC